MCGFRRSHGVADFTADRVLVVVSGDFVDDVRWTVITGYDFIVSERKKDSDLKTKKSNVYCCWLGDDWEMDYFAC